MNRERPSYPRQPDTAMQIESTPEHVERSYQNRFVYRPETPSNVHSIDRDTDSFSLPRLTGPSFRESLDSSEPAFNIDTKKMMEKEKEKQLKFLDETQWMFEGSKAPFSLDLIPNKL